MYCPLSGRAVKDETGATSSSDADLLFRSWAGRRPTLYNSPLAPLLLVHFARFCNHRAILKIV